MLTANSNILSFGESKNSIQLYLFRTIRDFMIKTCKKHGETDFRRTSKVAEKYQCRKCNAEAVQRRRIKLKYLSVEYKGGCCEKCGYKKCVEALEFHHKDPTEKDFGIAADGKTRSFDKIKVELDKCLLLCANCHREEHVRLKNIVL